MSSSSTSCVILILKRCENVFQFYIMGDSYIEEVWKCLPVLHHGWFLYWRGVKMSSSSTSCVILILKRCENVFQFYIMGDSYTEEVWKCLPVLHHGWFLYWRGVKMSSSSASWVILILKRCENVFQLYIMGDSYTEEVWKCLPVLHHGWFLYWRGVKISSSSASWVILILKRCENVFQLYIMGDSYIEEVWKCL